MDKVRFNELLAEFNRQNPENQQRLIDDSEKDAKVCESPEDIMVVCSARSTRFMEFALANNMVKNSDDGHLTVMSMIYTVGTLMVKYPSMSIVDVLEGLRAGMENGKHMQSIIESLTKGSTPS